MKRLNSYFISPWATIVKVVKMLFPIQIVVILLTAYLVGQRDVYIQRENFLFEKRADLLSKCSEFTDEFTPLLRNMTRGYGKYAIDAENPIGATINSVTLIPSMDLTGEQLEEAKWEILKYQKPLRKAINKSSGRRKNILRLVQNYTTDEYK